MKEIRDNKDDLSYVFESFNDYRNYYKILGINKKSLTDKEVREAYDRQLYQLKKMLEKCEKNARYDELKNKIETTLMDAYVALKSENSRKHYEELLDSIEKKKIEDEGEER